VHDYLCSVCADRFSVTEAEDEERPEGTGTEGAAIVCPACGSPLVRETWESSLRNAADRGSSRVIEEMRDRVG
jgi:DNA-directed RNA polymerase subunit RPC12/RpoP